MSYETAKTVKTIINSLDRGEFLIPLLQRDYVWKQDDICKLFDSLMRNYPINTFTMWECGEDIIKSGYKFYNFEPNYKYGTNMCDYPVNALDRDVVLSVIDGQQRLLSLYIALSGSYTIRGVEKYLYLNINRLLDASTSMDMKYEFKFKTEEDAQKCNRSAYKKGDKSVYWFKVKDVLEFKKETSVGKYIRNCEYLEDADDITYDILTELYSAICRDPKISYYIERNQSLDEVTDIFVRMNNCGKTLKKSDLFLSMAMLQWDDLELKDKINSLVDTINTYDNFNITSAYVLQTSVLVSTNLTRFGTKALNESVMTKIKNNWDRLSRSIKLTFEVLDLVGYTDNLLNSYDLVLPIVGYIYTNKLDNCSLSELKTRCSLNLIVEWVALATVTKINVHTYGYMILKIIRDNAGGDFPLSIIKEQLRGTKLSIDITKEHIDDILNASATKVNIRYMYALLKLLNVNRFNTTLSPIYDKKTLKAICLNEPKEVKEAYKKKANTISNYYIDDITLKEHRGSLDLNSWLDLKYGNDIDKINYLKELHIDSVDLSSINFKEVLDKREIYLTDILYKKLLNK